MNNLKKLLNSLVDSQCMATIGETEQPIRNWYILDGQIHLVTALKTLRFEKHSALEEIQSRIDGGYITAPPNVSIKNRRAPAPDNTQSALVHKTSDYSIFNIHKKNRDVNAAHVNNLVAAIQKNNLLAGQPILVNENMEVIDGQHRLEAAKKLGVDIYYIMRGGLTIEDAIDLNINTKNWSYADYLEYWISQGLEEYMYFKEYKERFEFSWMLSINLLHYGTTASQNSRDTFISGELKINHAEYAAKIGWITTKLKEYCSFHNDRSLVRAIDTSYRAGRLDPFLLIKKVKMAPDRLTKCSDTDSYLRMMEDVINYYNKGERVRLY